MRNFGTNTPTQVQSLQSDRVSYIILKYLFSQREGFDWNNAEVFLLTNFDLNTKYH